MYSTCGKGAGWGQKASWVNGKQKGASVFWKAKQTGIQGCKKVSCMNGHSSNLSRPTARTKVSHWRAVCVYRREIWWFFFFNYYSVSLNPTFLLFISLIPTLSLSFLPTLAQWVWRCTWTLPNYPWTTPAEVVHREWCKSVTFTKMSASFQTKQ